MAWILKVNGEPIFHSDVGLPVFMRLQECLTEAAEDMDANRGLYTELDQEDPSGETTAQHEVVLGEAVFRVDAAIGTGNFEPVEFPNLLGNSYQVTLTE